MDPKKAATEWFHSTVFKDEAIRPGVPGRTERAPSMIRAARSLESGVHQSWQSREALFLSPPEYRLLQCLLYSGDTGWVQEEGGLLSVLMDGVNEKLYDTFLDCVLDDAPRLLIFIDELVDIYKIPNAITLQKILTMYNDTLQGKAQHLGVILCGTPQCMEDPGRGVYSYEMSSRLADIRAGLYEYEQIVTQQDSEDFSCARNAVQEASTQEQFAEFEL